MPMTAREMLKLLKANGFEEISVNGSHRKPYNRASNKTGICHIIVTTSKQVQKSHLKTSWFERLTIKSQ